MQILKKYRFELVFFTLLTILFFFSRLYRIDTLPLFTDEAIYVRWSQIARYDANWRFISLTDGKQPSFIWLTMIAMRFIQDPLLSGRVVSVFAGFATTVGLFFLGRELFNSRWIGFFSCILYIIFPMALVYDRMALYDSLVGTFAIWSLFLSVLLVRRLRLDVALLLGMIAGGGVLTKTSGFFSIYLLPFTLLLFDWGKKDRWFRLLRWLTFVIIAVVLAYAYYSIQRLSPFFHIIEDKNAVFIYPFHEWIAHPFEFFYGNLRGVWDWFITYVTWPGFLLIVGAFLVERKNFREKILLIIWFLLPFVALALFARLLYPRFIFFMILYLLPLAAYSLNSLKNFSKKKVVMLAGFLAFAIAPLRADYFILTDFAHAPIPSADLGQYINNWPAGGGIKEMIDFLGNEAKTQKIYVATEGTFGSLPTNAVEIYLGDNKNVDKRGIWPVPKEIPQDLLKKAERMSVYVVFSQTQEAPDWPLTFIAKHRKGIGDWYMYIYRVDLKKVKK
ncbi:MAG: glycosyltransferase family 39 protein [Candidatus Levybacteria bacterium]|nr:glycosyltransferase family 39 protein [Candidatus Levybacteria bacterium]